VMEGRGGSKEAKNVLGKIDLSESKGGVEGSKERKKVTWGRNRLQERAV